MCGNAFGAPLPPAVGASALPVVPREGGGPELFPEHALTIASASAMLAANDRNTQLL